MENNHKERIMSCTTLGELLDVEYGKPETEERERFDEETHAFCHAENSSKVSADA